MVEKVPRSDFEPKYFSKYFEKCIHKKKNTTYDKYPKIQKVTVKLAYFPQLKKSHIQVASIVRRTSHHASLKNERI